MFQDRKILATSAFALLMVASVCRADSYDQAVNKYLHGFDYCNTAKELMGNGDFDKASASLKQYKKIKDEAAKIDPAILSSTRREMDSNLKYCERVANDLEVQIGMPTLDKAIAACDTSIQELKGQSPEAAREHYEQFKQLRDEALAIAPSLNDLFSARSQISRCNRFEKKILSFQQKQEESSRVVEAALDSSENYAATCTETANGVSGSALERQDLEAVKNSLQPIRSLKSLAVQDKYAMEQLAKPAFSEQKKQFDTNLATGDKCMASLETQVAAKEQEVSRYKAELNTFSRDLGRLDDRCEVVAKASPKDVDKARYQELSKQYDSVISERNAVQSRLNKSKIYSQTRDWPESKKINSNLASLNGCIEKSSSHLAVLFKESGSGAVAAAAAVVKPKPVPKPAASSSVSGPASTIKGTINLVSSTPQLAIVYLEDSASGGDTQQIVINPSGFDKRYYTVTPGDVIRLKSKDFAFHRTSINIPGVDYPNEFAYVQSRQQKEVKVDWPANTIATLRSDRASIVPAFIANIPTRDFAVLDFDGSSSSSSFELNTTGKKNKGFILMSGYDPIPFELNKGQTEAVDVLRDATVSGNVLLQGM